MGSNLHVLHFIETPVSSFIKQWSSLWETEYVYDSCKLGSITDHYDWKYELLGKFHWRSPIWNLKEIRPSK
jgi:hypothetical protein